MKHTRTITPTEMRVINRSAILDLIRRESPISRSIIARKLDVSLPTVMRIVDGLMEEGLVRDMGIAEWSGGRRRSLLEFNSRGQVMIGVDLGGNAFYGAVSDLAGTILKESRLPHPGKDSEACYRQLVLMLETLLVGARQDGVTVRGIGVGAPGITDYEHGVVRWAPSLDWRNFALRKRLVDHFGLPVTVENDVNLSALGELWFGSEQNVDSLALLSVGTGIGAGIMLDGGIFRGAHQAAGEVGYLLPDRSFLGWKNHRFGATEEMASTPGILQRARERLRHQGYTEDVEQMGLEDVLAAYAAGQPWAVEVLDETADYLAMCVIALGVTFDPDVIVLGGDLAQFQVLVELTRERTQGVLLPEIKVVTSALGRRAAVMGAITNVLHRTADLYVLRSMA
jgi:predicted NBD/HSP70 family sugar kinase